VVRKPARALSRPPINVDADGRTALKNALDVVRKHVRGYDAREGYGLQDVIRFSKPRQRALLKKAAQIKELLASPHDLVRPRNEKEKRALRPFARKQLRGAKHYIVHKPTDGDRVALKQGRVRITRKRGRVEIDSVYFMFPHAPRSEGDAIDMLEDMLPEMPKGFYIMQTGAHGDTGEPVAKGALLERLRRYINDYEQVRTTVYDAAGDPVGKVWMPQGFTQSVMGFRYTSSTLDGALVDKHNVDARREASKAFNEKLRKSQMTPAEKLEAKAQWSEKRGRQKRRKAAKKAAKTRARNKKAKAKHK
jgi:hypothetical protein